jgi:MFS family permease
VRAFLNRRFEFLTVLRNRDYRTYYLGMVASVTSLLAMTTAQGWLVFDMTGSPAVLGLVAGLQALPGLVFNLVAGALADRMDPRRIIVYGEGTAAATMVVLGVIVVTGNVEVWHVAAAAFITGIATSFDQPARRAVWPLLIPREQMTFGSSMNASVWNGTQIIAPSIAGTTIAVVGGLTGDYRLGAGIVHFILAIGFVSMAAAMLFINLPEVQRARGATVFHDIVDGLKFTLENRIFLILLSLSLVFGYFGLSYQWLMPVFAEDVFGVGPEGLGVLLSANGIGGFVGIVFIASFGQYQSRSWLIGIAGMAFGVSLFLFAITSTLEWMPLSMVLVATTGAIFSVFQIATASMLNLLVPHELRGRVMGLRGITWSLAPMGAFQAGIVADLVNVQFSVAIGAVVVVLFTGFMLLLSKDLRQVRRLVEEAGGVRAA